MIFDNIRRKVSGILLFALLILLLLYLQELFFGIPENAEWQNSVFTGCTDILTGKLSALISMFMVLIAGMLIYKINFDHISISGREHLLVWLWIVSVGGFSFLHPLSEIHFATVFVLLSYGVLFNVYKRVSDYRTIFLSSMYLGIATFFYSFAIYLFIPYIITLYSFKIAGFRDWIIAIAGFVVPFYFAIFVFHFLYGNWLYPIETTLNNIVPDNLSLKIVEMKTSQYTLCAFIAILAMSGMIMPTKLIRQGINHKTISCLRSISTLMLFSVLIYLLFAPESKLMLQIIFISATIYLRILFLKINKNIVANSLFILLFAASAVAIII